MDQVALQQVQWLWEPYIPFAKITIIQGDPGEGKTTLALRLAAACSTGEPLPGMEPLEPFNVIYQSAEDLIREMLFDGDEVPSEEIFKRALELGIGARTMNAAKKKIPGIHTRRSGNHWCWRMEA